MSDSSVEPGLAVVDIQSAPSIAEGMKMFGSAAIPFIVRGVTAFDLDYDQFKERAVKEGMTTFAWDKRLQMVTDVRVASAIEQWEKGELELNFTDSPIPKYVRNGSIHKDLLDIGVDEDRIMLVLSKASAYTPFHQDPIDGVPSGSGWMWLLRGSKRWQFLPFEHSDAIIDPVMKALNDLPTDELVRREDQRLWGKLMQVHARAGDFVYFPPACSHRVWTDEASIGVGGYIRLPGDEERIQKAVAWYHRLGLDPKLGIFRLAASNANCGP